MIRKPHHRVYIIVAATALVLGIVPGAGRDARAQLSLPTLPADLSQLPTDVPVTERTGRLGNRTQDAAETANGVVDEPLETVNETVAVATQTVQEIAVTATTLVRSLVEGTDPNGATIEENVIVAMVDAEQYDMVLDAGYSVLAKKDLGGLGMTLLTLRQPASMGLNDAVASLRKANPGMAVDYNHIYRFATDDDVEAGTPPIEPASDDAEPPVIDDKRLRIGVIDSAVMPEHRAFAGIEVVAQDFVMHESVRPLTHGTAVSSIIARSANDQVVIFSASVFYHAPNYAPGATTESLVAALDWLASIDADVINMSLAGPGNELLRAAVTQLKQSGPIIVAAVGNNGPNSDPLYPAAYDGPIGVTAVDRDNKVFRHANRGEYVDYAAIGVNVKVADSNTGGWRIESGTSMASPALAVIIAKMQRENGIARDAVMSWLMASAKDLGRKGHDKTYGHGLITRPPVVLSSN